MVKKAFKVIPDKYKMDNVKIKIVYLGSMVTIKFRRLYLASNMRVV